MITFTKVLVRILDKCLSIETKKYVAFKWMHYLGKLKRWANGN